MKLIIPSTLLLTSQLLDAARVDESIDGDLESRTVTEEKVEAQEQDSNTEKVFNKNLEMGTNRAQKKIHKALRTADLEKRRNVDLTDPWRIAKKIKKEKTKAKTQHNDCLENFGKIHCCQIKIINQVTLDLTEHAQLISTQAVEAVSHDQTTLSEKKKEIQLFVNNERDKCYENADTIDQIKEHARVLRKMKKQRRKVWRFINAMEQEEKVLEDHFNLLWDENESDLEKGPLLQLFLDQIADLEEAIADAWDNQVTLLYDLDKAQDLAGFLNNEEKRNFLIQALLDFVNELQKKHDSLQKFKDRAITQMIKNIKLARVYKVPTKTRGRLWTAITSRKVAVIHLKILQDWVRVKLALLSTQSSQHSLSPTTLHVYENPAIVKKFRYYFKKSLPSRQTKRSKIFRILTLISLNANDIANVFLNRELKCNRSCVNRMKQIKIDFKVQELVPASKDATPNADPIVKRDDITEVSVQKVDNPEVRRNVELIIEKEITDNAEEFATFLVKDNYNDPFVNQVAELHVRQTLIDKTLEYENVEKVEHVLNFESSCVIL